MNRFYFLIILFFCFSCKKTEQDELFIKYNGFRYYLKMNKNADALLPPLIFLKFNVKNLSDSDKVFTCRGSIYDDIKSKMYIYDTIKKTKIELFVSDIEFIKPQESSNIEAKLDVRSNADVFKLDKAFLKKDDYSGEKKKLDDILMTIKGNSILIYSNDTSDLGYFRLQNPNVTAFKKKEYKILW